MKVTSFSSSRISTADSSSRPENKLDDSNSDSKDTTSIDITRLRVVFFYTGSSADEN
jgi:hypothetical protein